MPVATNRYVPVRARVTGALGDADLERLAVAIRRAVAARIAFAERRGSRVVGSVELGRERWDRR